MRCSPAAACLPASTSRASLFLVVYDGFAPFGRFPSTEVRYYGASLQFDF